MANLLTGNPIYPGGILEFQKPPDFLTQNWYPITSLIENPSFIFTFITALISEYLFWIVALVTIPVVLIAKKAKSKSVQILGLLGLVNFAIYFFIPSNPGAVISDVRYLFPTFITLILALFLLAKEYKRLIEIEIIAILAAAAVLPQFLYRPKIAFVWLIIVFVFIISRRFRYLTYKK